MSCGNGFDLPLNTIKIPRRIRNMCPRLDLVCPQDRLRPETVVVIFHLLNVDDGDDGIGSAHGDRIWIRR